MNKKNYLLTTAVVMMVVFCLQFLGCSGIGVEKYYTSALATTSPIATEAGRKILNEGGNAFDAAVAVAFVLAVVHPEAGNLGGGGFALMRDGTSGEITSLDFRETAPLAAGEKMFLDENDQPIENLSLAGAKAAGVPGTVAGLYDIWQKKGSLPWDKLIGPATDLANSGFIIDDYLAESLNRSTEKFRPFNQSYETYFSEKNKVAAGDKLVLKKLARALYIIAAEGADGFYKGELADSIVTTMLAYDGLITHEDLLAYQPIWREPFKFKFDSLDIYTMAPPSSGGVVMGQILKIIEPFDFGRYHPLHVDYINLFTEASRLAFADRSQHLGDPDYYDIPFTSLSSESYLDERRAMITKGEMVPFEKIKPGMMSQAESDQTTHFSICDSNGNIVSITYTINTEYGSKLMVNGFGILLNNEMDDFSIKPGVQNTYGLIGGSANKIEPGKRMLSSMSPTIVLKNSKPCLVLGSPGGSKIITVVAQAIINYSRFGLSPKENVNTGRFHHQWIPDKLYLEETRFDISIKQDLIRIGYTISERTPYSDLQLLYIDPSGMITGASDPRNRGTFDGN